MTTTKSTQSAKSNGSNDMLARHKELIAQYDAATTSGVKAGKSRAIISLEADMIGEGVDFAAWERPSTVRNSYALSEEDLLDSIARMQRVLASDKAADAHKSDAERRLGKFVEQAEKRGVEVGS
jgi:hypothetical protein